MLPDWCMSGSVVQRLGFDRLSRLTAWNYSSPDKKASEPEAEDEVADWGEQVEASCSNGNHDAVYNLEDKVVRRAMDIPFCEYDDEDEKVLSGHFFTLQTEIPRRWYHRRKEVEQS